MVSPGNDARWSRLNMSDSSVVTMASNVMDASVRRGWHIAAAESLTGGLLSDAFVSVPGASRVFCGSAVTYDIHAKSKVLGVDCELLQSQGAVNQQVAMSMAAGAARVYRGCGWEYGTCAEDAANFPILGLSTTGVAGPGPDGDKPAGLVFVGLLLPGVADLREELLSVGRLVLEQGDSVRMWDRVVDRDVALAFELHEVGDREAVRKASVYRLLHIAASMLGADTCLQ